MRTEAYGLCKAHSVYAAKVSLCGVVPSGTILEAESLIIIELFSPAAGSPEGTGAPPQENRGINAELIAKEQKSLVL